MNTQGQKTGGRQKGTPNKLTASMKYLTKTLFLNNYELLEQSFQQCKPAERLNFYAKMQPYLCARETSNDNGGEWAIGQNMELLSIQQMELEALYQKKQNIELNYINALSSFQKTANERWNDIKEQMAAAQHYGVEQQKLNDMFQNVIEQFTQEYEQNRARLENSFEKTRLNIQAKIDEQEDILTSTPSPAPSATPATESNTPATESNIPPTESNTPATESSNQAADQTSKILESPTSAVESPTSAIESPTATGASSAPDIASSTPIVASPTTDATSPTPAVEPPTPSATPSNSSHSTPPAKTATHTTKSASAPHPLRHNQPQPRIPFYANLKQKHKLRKSRK